MGRSLLLFILLLILLLIPAVDREKEDLSGSSKELRKLADRP